MRCWCLSVYIPLLGSLFLDLYKKVIELNVASSFWRFIWVIPALTYLVFYVKFISDYWKSRYIWGRGYPVHNSLVFYDLRAVLGNTADDYPDA